MLETVWVQLITAQAQAEAVQPKGITEILLEASGVVLGVLCLLMLMSLVSWFIIGYKWFYLQRAQRESVQFLEVFWQSKRLDAIYQKAEEYQRSPISQVFRAGYIELSKLKGSEESGGGMTGHLSGIENVERALRRAATSEMTHLESKLAFLATVGSNAPFIGLFGTVWGIMVAFVNLQAKGATGIEVVAGPIAEALIVTAFGLFTAIPAGVAYNWFLSKIRVVDAEMDNFSNDFLNIVKRHFFK
ncbi:MAG: protein TolQ [Myxococcota bacterium]|jgi:biopolymer transport protein TolQ|nr:protein TolQ [Myxococcota bacterium]